MSHLAPLSLGVIGRDITTVAQDNFIFFDAANSAAAASVTAFARSILDDASEAVFKATVNLEIGTDVQAFGALLDDLNTLGASAADGEFLVATGAGTLAWESGATARTSIGLGTGDSPTFTDLILSGDLFVQGDKFAVDAESILLRSNYLSQNVDYTTAVAQTGGIAVNYLPTATADTVAAGGFTAATTVATTGAATFAAGDLIMVSGTVSNDGFYEVATHALNVLTIDSTPAEGFSQSAFVVVAGAVGAITKVTIACLRAGTDGTFEAGAGATTPIAYTDLASATSVTLDAAYGNGAAITLDAGDGDLTIAGSATGLWTWANAAGHLVSTSGAALTVAGLVTAQAGITVSGAAADIQDVLITDARRLNVATFATGAHALAAAEDFILYTGTGVGTDAVTLPAATATGRRCIIKATGAAPDLDVTPLGADTIDGVTGTSALVLAVQYASVTLVDGAAGAWSIV